MVLQCPWKPLDVHCTSWGLIISTCISFICRLAITMELGGRWRSWACSRRGGLRLLRGVKGMFSEPVLQEIAAKHGKTAAQVILRWNIQQGVVIIQKSTSVFSWSALSPQAVFSCRLPPLFLIIIQQVARICWLMIQAELIYYALHNRLLDNTSVR